MEAKIVKLFPITFEPYIKYYILRLRVECPTCKKKIKHGMLKRTLGEYDVNFVEPKTCLHCNSPYLVLLNFK